MIVSCVFKFLWHIVEGKYFMHLRVKMLDGAPTHW